MRLLIIGSKGFIGSHLAAYAAECGFDVIGLSRGRCSYNGNEEKVEWSLGQSLPDIARLNIDCAIHLAHDFSSKDGARLTIDGTIIVANQLYEAGTRRQLFFSSYSASKHASSLYGITKFELESRLSHIEGVGIVRPGLVLGNKGLYGRIRKWAQVLPIIPLPDGGRGLVPVIEIDHLCEESIKLVTAVELVQEANIFERELKSLRQLVLDAAAEVGRKPWIFPVPSSLLINTLRIADALHFPLPVNADNLAGFVANQSAKHISTLE